MDSAGQILSARRQLRGNVTAHARRLMCVTCKAIPWWTQPFWTLPFTLASKIRVLLSWKKTSLQYARRLRNCLHSYDYSFALSPSRIFLLRRELMLFRWIRSAPGISSLCCCHPITRPSLIIVHLVVVSPGAMYACWHNTEIEQRTRREETEEIRERENTRSLKGSSWARSRTSNRSYSCSGREGEVRQKQYHILMGVAINHFLLLPVPLTSIGKEHERTMILSRLMHVCLHQSVFLRCHSCSIIIFLLLLTAGRFFRVTLTFSMGIFHTFLAETRDREREFNRNTHFLPSLYRSRMSFIHE